MKEVVFKDILIADTLRHKAHYQTFQKGLNVITSKDNHVGKSSLLKSLYYSLGAEVKFDNVWDRNSKIYITTISVDEIDYKIARFQKSFAIFQGENLILLTNSVGHELAAKMEEIYSFAIYLADKNDNTVKLAPPALTYMPYYIDQDKGWNDLYGSFESLEQFKKSERKKSLYYHLQIYTRQTIELMAKRDELKSKLDVFKEEEQKMRVTVASLSQEMNNLVPADNIEDFDKNTAVPKEEITDLVGKLGVLRNEIQRLESSIQQNEHQLGVINEYKKIKQGRVEEKHTISVCPRCGYNFDEELYDAVRNNYNISNEDYLCHQVQYILDKLKEQIKKKENEYVELSGQLKTLEKSYDISQDAYSVYLQCKGLQKTLNKYSSSLKDNLFAQHEFDDNIREIDKEIRRLPNKKEIENIYIDYVRLNIIGLNAWDSSYEGAIKLLEPVKAQGSLVSKIILAQTIGLFQTMEAKRCKVTKFPFVIDSPRGNEASDTSSRDILEMIGHVTFLPQVILATVDYDKYKTEGAKASMITRLSNKNSLLSGEEYESRKTKIIDMVELLKSLNNVKK